MTVELRVVDTTDEAALRAWWEVGDAAEAERPHRAWPRWEQSRVALPSPHPERELTLVTAYDGERAVGASMTALPTKDNPHLAFVELWVVPGATTRGHRHPPGRRPRGAQRRRGPHHPARGGQGPARRTRGGSAVRRDGGLHRRQRGAGEEPRPDHGSGLVAAPGRGGGPAHRRLPHRDRRHGRARPPDRRPGRAAQLVLLTRAAGRHRPARLGVDAGADACARGAAAGHRPLDHLRGRRRSGRHRGRR